ncbi:3-oxoacyl-ACP reductase family protein [Mycolicibacterium baixiangningiae]|uniref:3-oxoacyl-ACP reductase family protein n=1 Tax=Mycolicibacterium baixiangningiae TaxID=2761578 RepID=UPI0018D0EA4B|nr:3-oxoacyl-ACP reductase family protein [Mycolicibacterium baixiangningiae]
MMAQPLPLSGKAALVTGASRGIGAAIARELALRGASVMVTYRSSPQAAAQLVESITSGGGQAQATMADSAHRSDVVDSVQATVDAFGGLDILVNNAAVGGLYLLADLSDDDIEQFLSVNVRAMMLATREALTVMPPGGRIINIGSVNADRTPIPGGSVYAATKAAMAGFTRGLARELAPRGITVNNIQPGPVDTDLNPATGPQAGMMLNAMALDRFGTVDEIADFVAFLADERSGYITGASLTIDGGFAA